MSDEEASEDRPTVTSSSDQNQPSGISEVTTVQNSAAAEMVYRAAAQEIAIGGIVKGRYLIEKELGHGGIGQVYLARDQQLHNKPVVIKVLLARAEESQWLKKKFRQEVEALTRIDHPGIVGVLDSGETGEQKPFFVMQFIDGQTLRKKIPAEGMELGYFAYVIRQIGQALSAAHEKMILHRDLKPDNIMLQVLSGGEEQVKIIDFGIAKVADSMVDSSSFTNHGSGTVPYMSPEQLMAAPLNESSDIYALGVIAYEMLTGRRPFVARSIPQQYMMQREGLKVKASDLRIELPGEIDRVLLKALSFNPQERYPSARQFTEELVAVIATEIPISTPLPQLKSTMIRPAAIATSQPAPAGADAVTGGNNVEGRTRRTGTVTRPRRWLPLLLAGSFFAVSVAVLAVWQLGWFKQIEKRPNVVINNKGTTPIVKPSLPEIRLSYAITMKTDDAESSPSTPVDLTQARLLLPLGSYFKFTINNTQAGYLYLINEGAAVNGEQSYSVLFPTISSHQGSSQLHSDDRLQIPEQSWFQLGGKPGSEKIWLIWSAQEIKELAGLVARESNLLKDAEQRAMVKSFLRKHSVTYPTREIKDQNLAILRSEGDLMVQLIELQTE